ncbi:hypothetical protein [Azospirillum sp. Sh1]|uniref:hypothetical protein n=1 Tax=Azospirillum sp. Sh1 TaxID=2607285 RepID=UPI0011F02998|nr:hypothetical protein [Azospirillum sp. Sh1]KAA0576668.1 hypothetical protein FZ029_12435 [Azospirillum sp. Sh1]
MTDLLASPMVAGLMGPLDKQHADAVPGLQASMTTAQGNITTLQQGLTTAQGGVATSLQQGVHTIWLPAIGMVGRTTNGPVYNASETTTNRVMIAGLDYDPNTAQYAQVMVAMPKSWDRGTVTAQVVWTALSGSGSVVWGVQGLAVGDGDALDVAFGTAVTVSDPLLSASQSHLTTTTAAMTIAGSPAALDTVIFQVYRDAANGADTLTSNARLLGVRLYLTINAQTDA